MTYDEMKQAFEDLFVTVPIYDEASHKKAVDQAAKIAHEYGESCYHEGHVCDCRNLFNHL